jgi:hypothetical protein
MNDLDHQGQLLNLAEIVTTLLFIYEIDLC